MNHYFKIIISGALLWAWGQVALGADPEGGGDIATHGEIVLNAADIHAAMTSLSPLQITPLLEDHRAREALATDLLLRRILAQRARSSGSDRDPAIAPRLRIATDRILTDLYLEYSENSALDEASLEALAREEYRAFPERYRAEEIHARHILIGKHPSCQNDPQKIAEELRVKLADGASFEELARQYSDDPRSAAKGGDLGWITRGRMVKPFEDALFALRTPGEVSPPVVTQFGGHLIQLLERKPAELRAFEDVKASIVEALRIKKRQEMRNKLLESLKDPALLRIDAGALEEAVKAARQAGTTSPAADRK